LKKKRKERGVSRGNEEGGKVYTEAARKVGVEELEEAERGEHGEEGHHATRLGLVE
jgi:hypothetical protein